jgi:hypothetical protein
MSVRRFPCRWCRDLTEGVDEYILCDGCFGEVERRGMVAVTPWDDAAHSPITPALEASLRKLLDW